MYMYTFLPLDKNTKHAKRGLVVISTRVLVLDMIVTHSDTIYLNLSNYIYIAGREKKLQEFTEVSSRSYRTLHRSQNFSVF